MGANFTQLDKTNWRAEIVFGSEDGKRKRTTKQGFKTKKAAQEYARSILNNADRGYIVDKKNSIPFETFINDWYNDYKKLSIGISTQASYRGRLDTHIITKLGHYKLCDISNKVIQDFYNSLLKDGLMPSSAKKVMDILIGCFKYAKKQKLIMEMPTDIEKVKAEKPMIEYWNKKEIDYYLDQIKGSYLYTPILIDVLTGLRVGELCGLRWKDIHLEDGYINIHSQVIRDKESKTLLLTSILKTSTSNRKISIPGILIRHLQHIKDTVKPTSNEFVVKDRDDNMCNPRNLSMNFTKNIKKYENTENDKIPHYMQLPQITFHGLRHTHATVLLLHGENIKVLSERLGHKDTSTTMNTYLHVMDDMKQNTAKLLDDLFDE